MTKAQAAILMRYSMETPGQIRLPCETWPEAIQRILSPRQVCPPPPEAAPVNTQSKRAGKRTIALAYCTGSRCLSGIRALVVCCRETAQVQDCAVCWLEHSNLIRINAKRCVRFGSFPPHEPTTQPPLSMNSHSSRKSSHKPGSGSTRKGGK